MALLSLEQSGDKNRKAFPVWGLSQCGWPFKGSWVSAPSVTYLTCHPRGKWVIWLNQASGIDKGEAWILRCQRGDGKRREASRKEASLGSCCSLESHPIGAQEGLRGRNWKQPGNGWKLRCVKLYELLKLDQTLRKKGLGTVWYRQDDSGFVFMFVLV